MRGTADANTVGTMDDILSTHPSKDTFDLPQLRAAIDAAARCASSCSTCADACLHGEHVEHMVRCIDLDTQCAAICRPNRVQLPVLVVALIVRESIRRQGANTSDSAARNRDRCDLTRTGPATQKGNLAPIG